MSRFRSSLQICQDDRNREMEIFNMKACYFNWQVQQATSSLVHVLFEYFEGVFLWTICQLNQIQSRFELRRGKVDFLLL